MNAPQRDIRGVLITVNQGRLLLPNASVAEVITFSDPEPVENAPDWLLGRSAGAAGDLPLLSFSRFAGWSNEEGQTRRQGGGAQGTGRQSEAAVLRRAVAGLPAPGDGVHARRSPNRTASRNCR